MAKLNPPTQKRTKDCELTHPCTCHDFDTDTEVSIPKMEFKKPDEKRRTSWYAAHSEWNHRSPNAGR